MVIMIYATIQPCALHPKGYEDIRTQLVQYFQSKAQQPTRKLLKKWTRLGTERERQKVKIIKKKQSPPSFERPLLENSNKCFFVEVLGPGIENTDKTS